MAFFEYNRIFDKSKIKNMQYMFSYSSNITLDLSIFNTQYMEDMSYLFYHSNFEKLLNFTSLNTSSVKGFGMIRMFDSSRTSSVDLTFFNTSLITSMYLMFSNSSFNSLDLSFLIQV